MDSSEIKKEEIILAEQKLLDAIKNRNINVLDELLHDDLLFIIPSGETITKEIDLASHRSGNMSINTITSQDALIHCIEDNAVVSIQITLEGIYMDQPINGEFRYFRVWKQCNGNWKVIGGSCTPL